MSTVFAVCHEASVRELGFDRDKSDDIRFVRYTAASQGFSTPIATIAAHYKKEVGWTRVIVLHTLRYCLSSKSFAFHVLIISILPASIFQLLFQLRHGKRISASESRSQSGCRD